MGIRSQLVALVAAVIAPVALLAALAASGWYRALEDVHSQRYVERVRALRLALDTEIRGSVRLLQAFAERDQLTAASVPPAEQLQDSLRRMLHSNPMWSSVSILETDGSVSAFLGRDAETASHALDPITRDEVTRSGKPALSNLVSSPNGKDHFTFVVVPALKDGRTARLVTVGIHHAKWLAFLGSYPIATDATLTLNDRSGRVIARTLNNDQWVGKMSRPGFLAKTQAADEGSFVDTGLEGQRFYIAFSHLATAPWTLGTGVPAETVRAAARQQALLVGAGVMAALVVAAALALLLARRITHAFSSLAELLPMGDAERKQAVARPLGIAEADDVRLLLQETLEARNAALRSAEAARMQAERSNAAKDEFVAMLAHELRNPLSAMAASVSLLESPRATPQSNLQARQVLRRQVDQSTMLVNDLLDTARLNAGQVSLHRTAVDLAQIASETAHGFAEACKVRGLELSVKVESAVVDGDAARLEQVVVNLLHNAMKFTKPGGHIGVEVRGGDGMATLRVSDDGIGIAAEMLPRVFEPYVQAEPGFDRARGGLGLGLHLVKQLVAMHGGFVVARSTGAGQGSTFEVRLPLHAGASAAAPVPPAAAVTGALRVAVVEDNPDVRDAVTRLLRMAGHDIATADRGDSGLELVRRMAPDVALVDLGLPGLDGFELARRLRAQPGNASGTLLIALTAYGDDATRARALQAGFDALLQKPFDLDAFQRAFKRVDLVAREAP